MGVAATPGGVLLLQGESVTDVSLVLPQDRCARCSKRYPTRQLGRCSRSSRGPRTVQHDRSPRVRTPVPPYCAREAAEALG